MAEPNRTSDPENPRRFAAALRYVGIALALCILAIAYSYFVEPNRLVVNRHELHITELGPAADGLKIVAISDIHGGSNGVDEAKLRQIVETANAQDPDLIVLLGDYVSQTGGRDAAGKRRLKMPVETIGRSLFGLRARLGVFAVLGNHDGWHDNTSISNALEQAGIDVLNGETAVVERNGARLRILGLKDHLAMQDWDRFADEARALLAPAEGSGDVLVLQHSPDVLPAITGERLISGDLRLMIAGHTHGGQVWLPVFARPIVPSSYGQKYSAGHVRDNGLDLFVTTGVGTSILPFRFMVPPEISVLTLRSAETPR